MAAAADYSCYDTHLFLAFFNYHLGLGKKIVKLAADFNSHKIAIIFV